MDVMASRPTPLRCTAWISVLPPAVGGIARCRLGKAKEQRQPLVPAGQGIGCDVAVVVHNRAAGGDQPIVDWVDDEMIFAGQCEEPGKGRISRDSMATETGGGGVGKGTVEDDSQPPVLCDECAAVGQSRNAGQLGLECRVSEERSQQVGTERKCLTTRVWERPKNAAARGCDGGSGE